MSCVPAPGGRRCAAHYMLPLYPSGSCEEGLTQELPLVSDEEGAWPVYEVEFDRAVHTVYLRPHLFAGAKDARVIGIAKKHLSYEHLREGDLLRILCRAESSTLERLVLYRQVTGYRERPGTTNNLLVSVCLAAGAPVDVWDGDALQAAMTEAEQ